MQDLFFNVPARRKFLKKPGTEFGHIEEIVRRMALTHFDIRFVLEHNQTIKLNLPVADSGALRFQRVQQYWRQFTENATGLMQTVSICVYQAGSDILRMHGLKPICNMSM